jgi:Uma2 family endonuclease
MKAVLLDIPPFIQCWMDERARLDQDRSDEMWDGVLHMVPPPDAGHSERQSWLLEVFRPLARARGLFANVEMGVFEPGRTDSYRVPDLVISAGAHRSKRGVEGRAEFVMEIRSPYDEAWEKVPFFAQMGIPEYVIIERGDVALLRLDPETATYVRAAPDADGWLALDVLPVAFRSEPTGEVSVRTPDQTVLI